MICFNASDPAKLTPHQTEAAKRIFRRPEGADHLTHCPPPWLGASHSVTMAGILRSVGVVGPKRDTRREGRHKQEEPGLPLDVDARQVFNMEAGEVAARPRKQVVERPRC